MREVVVMFDLKQHICLALYSGFRNPVCARYNLVYGHEAVSLIGFRAQPLFRVAQRIHVEHVLHDFLVKRVISGSMF